MLDNLRNLLLSHVQKFKLGMQAKLLLIAIPLLLFFTITISYAIIERENNIMYQDTVQLGLSIAKSAALLFTNARIYEELEMVDPSGMSEYLEYFMEDMMLLDPRMRGFQILDTEGRVLAHNNLREYAKMYEDLETKALLNAKKVHVKEVYSEEEQHVLHITVPLAIASKFWGLCRIKFSLNEMYAYNRQLRNEIIIISLILLFFSSMLVWLAGKHFVSPIRTLSKTMKEVTLKDELPQNLPEMPSREDEIGKLQSNFIWMLTRLQEIERERLRSIDGMLQAEKMATVGQLASGLAHEINNPLGGTILCFQNLCEGDMDEQMRKQHIEVINQSLEKIRCTVGEFLRFARPTPLSIRESSLEEMFIHCQHLAEFTLSRHGVRIHIELMEDMPKVFLDPDKIGQVLLNLVLNAAHAINPLRAEMHKDASVLLKAYTENDVLYIIVADTGPGVGNEIKEKIFDPFFSDKPEGLGTGLGLAVSSALVAQHQGTLRLVSNVVPVHDEILFKGAVFELMIPQAVNDI